MEFTNLKYILNSLTIADRIILGLALILIIWMYIHYWGGEETLDYAIILSPQQPPQTVNLYQSQQIKVQGSLGESKIEVSNGKIRFIKSPCKQQYCVHAGWLTNNFITCLPNQVSIELPNINKFDSISY